jgi:tol-pal system protein YbgF
MRRSLAVALGVVPLLAIGCASSPFTTNAPSNDQVQALEQRVLELQRKAAMGEIELDRLRQRIAELEARQGITPRTSALVPAPKTTPARPAPPPPPEPVYREQPVPIEERDLDVSAPKPAPTQPTTPSAPKSSTAPAPVPPSESPSAGPNGGHAPEPVTPAIQALYDRGYTLYHQGHYVDAETSFQRFLQAHPSSELSDNAQYWIGECRYSRGDYRGALAAFRETVARFPEGNKVPDALLKAGESLEKIGDNDGARAMYQEVVRRFPQSAVASVAAERRSKLP